MSRKPPKFTEKTEINRVMLDASSIQHGMNGVKRYAIILIAELSLCFDEVHVFVTTGDVFDGNFDHLDNLVIHSAPTKSKILSQIFFMPLIMLRNVIGTFISINHRFPIFLPHLTRKIMVVHDLCWKRFPETMKKSTLWSERLNFNRSVRIADKYIFLSVAMHNEFVSFFSQDNKPHHVLFPKYDFHRVSSKHIVTNEPYFLFVGTIEPRKNLEILIDAFSLLSERNSNRLKLILVGKKGWIFRDTIEKLRSSKASITVLHDIDQQGLDELYAGSLAVICPSKYEGFGLPALESIIYGKPLICSDIPPHREIAGEAALYCHHEDTMALLVAMESLLNPKKRQIYQALIFKRRSDLQKITAPYQKVLSS